MQDGRDSRSRSPHSRHHHSRHHHHHRRRRSLSPARKASAPVPAVPVVLPRRARQLSKRDLDSYRSLFTTYLDIQKGIVLDDLPDKELRGRWKSFINKWNRGELPEGWYDPETKRKADDALANEPEPSIARPASPQRESHEPGSSDDDYGPAPVHGHTTTRNYASGPSAPSFADLADRDAVLAEDRVAAREARQDERKLHRKQERERIDEIAPRAEPGTRERQLEKKKEVAASTKAFSDAREAGGVQEVDDSELMGSGEGGAVEARRVRAEHERRRSEREIRKEEAWRAKKAEREERVAVQRAKEQTTVDMLKAIAKERFG